MLDHKEERMETHEVHNGVHNNGVHNNGVHNGAPPRKGGAMNTLYPPGPKPGAGGRMKNHCRRFWWCDCLVLAIIILVVILPVIFVAIPKKAQNDLNKSTLEVTEQIITSPTPDQVHLKLVTIAKSSSKFHPTLDGFEGELSLKGQEPFLTVNIPKVKANKETTINVEQDVPIKNMDAFKMYTKVALGSEEFEVHLNGKTKINLKGLPTMDGDYNKVIKLKGLNGLKGLMIYDLKVLSGKGNILEDGSNLVGTVYIPNPSVMTLALGDLTMNLAVDGKPIGTSLIPNLTLRPGNNTVPMQSRVDQIGLISIIKSKYTSGIIPLEITGNSTIYNGKNLPYYEEAVQHNVIKLDLDAGPALAAIGIKITDHA